MNKEIESAVAWIQAAEELLILKYPTTKYLQVLLDLAEQVLNAKVPEKENDDDLCQCEYPIRSLNDKKNLIWCATCDKQCGQKTWNSAIDAMTPLLVAKDLEIKRLKDNLPSEEEISEIIKGCLQDEKHEKTINEKIKPSGIYYDKSPYVMAKAIADRLGRGEK